MIPPTSIDGTDITGATIDGTDVQEITVDGDTVFTAGPDIPDSAVWQFNAQDEDTIVESGGEVVEWHDRAGDNDLIEGSASSYDSDAINGNPAIHFDSDQLYNENFTYSGDGTLFSVVEFGSGTGNQMGIVSGSIGTDGNSQPIYYHDGSPDEWRIRHVDGPPQVGGSSDKSIQLLTSILRESPNDTILREEGTQTGSLDDQGEHEFDELHVGVRDDNDNFWNGYIGFLEFHDTVLSGDDLTDRESEIADIWGIELD